METGNINDQPGDAAEMSAGDAAKFQRIVKANGIGAAPKLSADRGDMVTASAVPSIAGENPFCSPREQFVRQAYRVRSRETPSTAHGHHFEEVARARFCKRHPGAQVRYIDLLKKDGWLGGTLDSIALLEDGRCAVVEIKCPFTRKIEHDIAPWYYGQVQTYMYICDVETCRFVQYRPSGPRRAEEYDELEIPRDREYMDALLPRLRAFHRCLMVWRRHVEPLAQCVAEIYEIMWRLHKTTQVKDCIVGLCKLVLVEMLFRVRRHHANPIVNSWFFGSGWKVRRANERARRRESFLRRNAASRVTDTEKEEEEDEPCYVRSEVGRKEKEQNAIS